MSNETKSEKLVKLQAEYEEVMLDRLILQEKEKIRQITKIREKALKKP